MRASIAGFPAGLAVSLRGFGSGRGAGARCVANQTSPEAAVNATDPAIASGQRLRGSVLTIGSALDPAASSRACPRTVDSATLVAGADTSPAPATDRPELLSRFRRFRSARIS